MSKAYSRASFSHEDHSQITREQSDNEISLIQVPAHS